VPADDTDAIDYQRLYAYRFRGVDQARRVAVWKDLAPWVHARLGSPSTILDPAAGRCEFINAVPAGERWAIDLERHSDAAPGIQLIVGDATTVELPEDYFDAVWVSNFLEHLHSQEEVAAFLKRMLRRLRLGGRIGVMGPNFAYCAHRYFDFADHTVALSHLSVAEHLYAAGFEIEQVIPRFLPYTFTGRVPSAPALVRLYLRTPFAWRVLGKQFLLVAQRPAG
jgi:SAM-dependent methyltransferase